MPLWRSSSPRGHWMGTGFVPRRSFMLLTHMRKSAPTLSILFMNATRGTLYLSAWRHTVSLCGSTPLPPSNTATAPSRTRRLRSTSMVKSTWPGVSMMLMRWVTPAVRALLGLPEAVRRGRRDRDAALLLLDHVVHGRGALVDLADLVVDARVVEDALGRRRLARVDVGHDADVARSLEGVLACHGSGLLGCCGRGKGLAWVCRVALGCTKPSLALLFRDLEERRVSRLTQRGCRGTALSPRGDHGRASNPILMSASSSFVVSRLRRASYHR